MPNLSDLGLTEQAPHSVVVREAEPADIPALRAFLESHIETSVFLLSNLDGLGIRVTPTPTSGNLLLIEDLGRVVGVFCLTRKGDLLAQTGGRADLAPLILGGCAKEPFPLTGVIAEWQIGEAIWRLLERHPAFTSVYRSKSVVYRLSHALESPQPPTGIVVRALAIDDYDVWEPVDRAFHAEEGLTVLADAERRRAGYKSRTDVSGWWGAFDGRALVSTACLNAGYRGTGQVGGVYTRPEWRRRGLARLVMGALMRDHSERAGLREVVLFAAEQNLAARALYESMGFTEGGRFGLLFGKWRDGSG